MTEDWDYGDMPLAYLITIRTFGTWLHGDPRGSVDRHGRNVYGTKRIHLDPMYSSRMEFNMEKGAFFFEQTTARNC